MGRTLRHRPPAARGRRIAALLRASLAVAALAALAALAACPAPAAAPDADGEALRRGAMEQGGIRVVYWSGHEARARRLLRAAQAPLRLPGLRQTADLTAGTVFLVPTPALWDSLTRGGTPGWAAGVALPRQRTILLPAFGRGRGDAVVTLRHELAHLAVHAALPEPVPRWFDEGYSTWVSGEWDAGSAWQLRLLFLLGRAPPLDSLTLQWPAGAGDARAAYLLAASAVQHLAERNGEEAFTQLIDAWKRDGSLSTALRSTYGMTLLQFEKEWRAVVQRRYGWALALSQWGVIWGALAPLVVWLAWWQRRRRRAQLRVLEREYRMLPAVASPASDRFWRVVPVEPGDAGPARQ